MGTFTWNNELVFELIDLFQVKPELWDNLSEDYKDRDKKQESWIEIAKAMNTDIDTVQKKMKMLMSQYRREQTKTKPSSKWFAYKKLEFLKSRKITSGRKLKSEGTATYYISMGPRQLDEQNSESMQDGGQRQEQVVLKGRLNDCVDPTRRDRKKSLKDVKDTNNETKVRDEYTTYGDLVAMKLRKIGNSYARSTAQYHINNILYKAEIGSYDKHEKRQTKSLQSRENFNRLGSSSPQRHEVHIHYDENSQMSSSASKSMDDLLKLENEDSDE